MPRISDFPAATSLDDDDVFVAADGSHTKKISLGMLKVYLADEAQSEPSPYDLAAAVRQFYIQILDAPLTTEMWQEWQRLSGYVAAVVEMAGKYVPLVEAEIDSKINDD